MDEPIALRTATAADATAIHELVHAAYAKWIPRAGRPPLPMTIDYAAAVAAHRFDLLFAGDVLAGLIETTPQGEDLLIVNVAVRPGFQGRGFGVRLLGLAEALAAAGGRPATRLYTNRLFTENVALYEALGYAVEREEPLNGGIVVHMRKACLAPSPGPKARP
jgi:ribosomal protein S18 acetylase RimI-like enzyme